MLERLRERALELRRHEGLRQAVRGGPPYLLEGLDIFVGFEPLIPEALAAGATGSVSGLAAVFPSEVAKVVRNPSEAGSRRMDELRALVDPILPMGKAYLARQGLMRPDMRAPLLPAASRS